METIYDVDYFLRKFHSIPEEGVIAHDQGRNGRHCAIGWCKNAHGAYGNSDVYGSKEAAALTKLFISAGIVCNDPYYTERGWSVAEVNNGDNERYQQDTPKQRILAALYDIKAKQQPEVKERIVYITVDAPVRELQKAELSLS